MADTQQTEQEARTSESQTLAPTAAPTESPVTQAPAAERPERKPAPQGDRPQGDRPQGDRPQGGRPREGAPQGPRREGGGPPGIAKAGEVRTAAVKVAGANEASGATTARGGDRGRFEGPPEIDIEKLISDPLYLDNQAHGVVSRMRDMDSGTKSQLRRLYNAVRRAVRAPENERQQQFVMLRARLAYTIARHSLRSLDSLEKLLLQVTRKNDARGYERFRDLFEAIVAYNE